MCWTPENTEQEVFKYIGHILTWQAACIGPAGSAVLVCLWQTEKLINIIYCCCFSCIHSCELGGKWPRNKLNMNCAVQRPSGPENIPHILENVCLITPPPAGQRHGEVMGLCHSSAAATLCPPVFWIFTLYNLGERACCCHHPAPTYCWRMVETWNAVFKRFTVFNYEYCVFVWGSVHMSTGSLRGQRCLIPQTWS